MVSEISELRQARLEDDLTYRELGGQLGLAASRVHHLVTAPSPSVNERTLFRIRQYLAQRKRSGRRQRRASA